MTDDIGDLKQRLAIVERELRLVLRVLRKHGYWDHLLCEKLKMEAEMEERGASHDGD